jgi:antitoxin YefM
MQTISYIQARNTLAGIMDKIIENHTSIKVDLGNDKRVVIISEKEYDSMVETLYLFTSSNPKRLLEAMEEIDVRIDSLEKK